MTGRRPLPSERLFTASRSVVNKLLVVFDRCSAEFSGSSLFRVCGIHACPQGETGSLLHPNNSVPISTSAHKNKSDATQFPPAWPKLGHHSLRSSQRC
jgi:hypothetical protein